MKDKTNIRYMGFRSANEGGRLFDFSFSEAAGQNFLTSFEIPARFFTGADRVRLQEGVSICYAKLKHLLEISPLTDVPDLLCLTTSDIAQYREVLPGSSKQRLDPYSPRSE